VKRKRVPTRNPVLAPLQCWPRHLRPETPYRHSPCPRSSSASSAPACEEASVQVLGLHTAGLTNLPLYLESSSHQGRSLLNDLHPPRESEGRRGRVSSSRKVVWARDCPTRCGTNVLSSLLQDSDDGESAPRFGPSLRWDTSDRGADEAHQEGFGEGG
jgi:hypothetical protein